MTKKVGGNVTVRGVMKRGRIELLDDVTIENGSLLDIVVIKTGDQVRLQNKANARAGHEVGSIRFAFTGKPYSDDPLVVFRSVPKSPAPRIRFEEYENNVHLVANDIHIALAKHILALGDPPPNVAKQLRGIIRKRQRLEISGESKAAVELRRDFLEQLEQMSVDDENRWSLWFLAATICTSDARCIPNAIDEILEYATEMDVVRFDASSRRGAHELHEYRTAARQRHEASLRQILFELLAESVRRSRRSLSGTDGTVKLLRKELTEIAKRLELPT